MDEYIALKFEQDINIALCGEAGSGIELASKVLMQILKDNGYNIFCSHEYMSRIRGGCNASYVRISDDEVSAPNYKIDVFFALDDCVFEDFKERISNNTLIFYNKNSPQIKKIISDIENGNYDGITSLKTMIPIDFTDLSKSVGAFRLNSIVVVGIILGILGVNLDNSASLMYKFINDDDKILKNLQSLKNGYEEGILLKMNNRVHFSVKKNEFNKNKMLLTGNDALALGCLKAGCNFVSNYPMTPGTGLYSFMDKNAGHFPVVTVQPEDEIAVINMAIGAWYAGARAMVSTSGGGFSLMAEGISLAGMIESPIVVHVAQRPGPATGLPTRTEQGDLDSVLCSGSGEFPRIIIAPSTPESAFKLAQKAFDFADMFQVPVFILTDQFFIDSDFVTKEFSVSKDYFHNHFVQSEKSYERYSVKSPISPRTIPSYGDGLVCVDSDEHNSGGVICENPQNRRVMVNKRLDKFLVINKNLINVNISGPENYKTLVITWGSAYVTVKEALSSFPKAALINIEQLYPLNQELKKYIDKAENLIIVENNATSQLGRLLEEEFHCFFNYRILQYNGLPFFVDELKTRLERIIC